MDSPEKVIIRTVDDLQIAALWYQAHHPKGWVLLVHMMPAVKESWDMLAQSLSHEGYCALAIDLRGHGESTGGPNGYKEFTDAEHQESRKDLEAAWEFLRAHGARPEATAVLGASIGANLALQFLADHSQVRRGALFSAGINYRGLMSADQAVRLSSAQEILLATSRDDDSNTAQNEVLYKALPSSMRKTLIVLDHGGHGTHMLSAGREGSRLSAAVTEFILHGILSSFSET
ncbi:alpha/beta fold hydrolase [Patescibacteria group bacterium]|nr:alpha/beta fold hydrolase [Patescibacteria group bacterium]